MAIGWIIVFLAVPAAVLTRELVRGDFLDPKRRMEHLLLAIWFIRALFELYGFVKTKREAARKIGRASCRGRV